MMTINDIHTIICCIFEGIFNLDNCGIFLGIIQNFSTDTKYFLISLYSIDMATRYFVTNYHSKLNAFGIKQSKTGDIIENYGH